MRILVCLLFVIALVAILGAGILPAALPAAAILTCAGCILAGMAPSGADRRLPLLAAAFVLFLVITALPLPEFMDKAVGHGRAAQNELARQAIADAGKLSLAHPRLGGFSISRDRAATVRIILLVIAAFAIAALAARLPAPRRETFVKALVVIGAIVAGIGYTGQWLVPQGKTLWWVFHVPHGQPVGGFLNRNHFGGFVALLCPAALTMFAGDLGRKRLFRAVTWALCFLVMTFAVVMSHSRGAWLAYAASMFAVVILSLSARRLWMVVAIVGLLVCVGVGVSRLPHEDLEERARSLAEPTGSVTAQMRLSTWRDTLRIIPDYTFLGTGANAFRMIFPQYRTATTRKSFKQAENEYLQIPTELGLIGTALLIGLGVAVARRWFRNHVEGSLDRLVEISVGGALIVAAVHAVFDFPIRIPLYGMVLASLVGLTLSPPPLPEPSGSAKPSRLWLAPLTGLVVAIFVSLQAMKPYEMDSSDFLQKADPDALCRALNWSPTSWQAWYHLGRAAIDKPDGTAIKLGEYCMSRAVDYDPNNYRMWHELCLVRLTLDDTEGARQAYSRLKALRTWQRIDEMERR